MNDPSNPSSLSFLFQFKHFFFLRILAENCIPSIEECLVFYLRFKTQRWYSIDRIEKFELACLYYEWRPNRHRSEFEDSIKKIHWHVGEISVFPQKRVIDLSSRDELDLRVLKHQLESA